MGRLFLISQCSILMLGAAFSVPLQAQTQLRANTQLQAQTQPPPSIELIGAACSRAFSGYGLDGTTGSWQAIDVTDPAVPFTKAVRIVNGVANKNTYDAVHLCNTEDLNGSSGSVAKGDLLVATFWIRNANTEPGKAILRIEPDFQGDGGIDFAANTPVDVGSWKRYTIPFRALTPGATGQKSFQLRFGIAAQTFEFGGVSLMNYGPLNSTQFDALKDQFAFYYPGRGDSNAQWRTTALANIEATRKASITITVTKADGSPATGARVRLKQTKSSFRWATDVTPDDILNSKDKTPGFTALDRQRYRSAIKANFNSASAGLFWQDWESRPSILLRTADWFRASGLEPVRTTNLIWADTNPDYGLPADIRDPSSTPAYINKRIKKYFDDELSQLKGKYREWDVVNEPYTSAYLQGHVEVPSNDPAHPLVKQGNGRLGNHAIIDWFKRARKDNPTDLLYLNDFNIFDTLDPLHRLYTYTLVKYMKAGGAPLDAIGFQSHFYHAGPIFTDMDETLKMFDPLVGRYSVTEFDFTSLDGSLQADITSDYMTYIFGSPKFNTFQVWDIWDGNHWLHSGPLYTVDWTLKPSGKVWQTLTQKTWRTNVSGSTDGAGQYATRAFLGTYQITVKACGKTTVLTQDITSATNLALPSGCS